MANNTRNQDERGGPGLLIMLGATYLETKTESKIRHMNEKAIHSLTLIKTYMHSSSSITNRDSAVVGTYILCTNHSFFSLVWKRGSFRPYMEEKRVSVITREVIRLYGRRVEEEEEEEERNYHHDLAAASLMETQTPSYFLSLPPNNDSLSCPFFLLLFRCGTNKSL